MSDAVYLGLSLLIAISIIQKYVIPILKKQLVYRKVGLIRENGHLKMRIKVLEADYAKINSEHAAVLLRKENWLHEAQEKFEQHLAAMKKKQEIMLQNLKIQQQMEIKKKEIEEKNILLDDMIQILEKKVSQNAVDENYEYIIKAFKDTFH